MDSASKRERRLQEILVQAVLFSHLEAVERAATALNEHFVKYVKGSTTRKTTGPLVLDFIIDINKHGWSKIPAKHKPLCMSHSPLMMALEVGQDEAAKKLIELGASVGFKNKDGLTAVHIACNKGKAEIVGLLLKSAEEQKRFCQKKGAKKDSDCKVVINAKERPQGWTPLMYAVKGGHTDTVRELMKYDFIRCDIENKKKQNVCHIAAREGKLECLELLHAKLGDDAAPFLTADKKNWNLLHQVCCCGDVEIFKWLLEAIPGLKTRDNLNRKSKEYRSNSTFLYTPLLVACDYQKIEIVKYLKELVDLDADLVDFTAHCHSSKTEDGHGFTGLHLAAVHNSEDIARLLIEAGCPLDVVDEKGNTALHVAYSRLSVSVVALIIDKCRERGIDSAVRNKDKKLPSEVEEEIIIPPEIKKRGEEAIKIYRRALDEGKDKIPYCSLLFLGKEKVGKTSLYRQLVGKEFLLDIISTRGIDNNIVDTVDRRSMIVDRETEDQWKEKKTDDSNEQFSDALASKLMEELPEKPTEKTDQLRFVVKEDTLLMEIDIIIKKELKEKEAASKQAMAQKKLPSTEPVNVSNHSPSPNVSIQPVPVNPPPVRPEEPPQPPQPPPQPKPPEHKERIQPQPAVPPPVVAPVQSRPVPRPRARKPRPVHDTQPAKKKEPTGMVNTRERSKVNEIVKGKQKHKKLQLEFNTLDFAGQKCYRPMHHCFISRRAMYMVVFKIPDMLDCNSNIADIKYWIHSIHAHIYPPDKDTKEQDKLINRVFLVGTHRNDHTFVELKKIDDLFKETLIHCSNDDRPVSHVHCREASALKYFFPVENSIDIKARNYLVNSGTKDLQDAVKSKDLPFLNEDHPIKWLKFEERLEQCHGEGMLTPVMTVEDVKKLAGRCNITDEDTQDLALKFFHDTGKIIYLKYHPGLKLFLKKEECKQLGNFIVLSPQWLMLVMNEIMELDVDHIKDRKLGGAKVKNFAKDGVTDFNLLKVCWKDYVSPEPFSSFKLHHLCWILQAYCLIYPIADYVTTATATGDVATGDTTDATADVTVVPTDCQRYMIPCRLPDDFKERNKLSMVIKKFVTFFFDFGQFLLDEIYYKLICLASARAKPQRSCNQYSRKKCNFFGLEKTNWVMEIEEDRLKIKVIVKRGVEPVEYIDIIHKYLCEICEDSSLEGLAYQGGPEVKCKDCEEWVMLHYVEYPSDRKENDPVECPLCLAEYDINQLMCPSPGPDELSKCALEKDITSDLLNIMKWRDANGKEQVLKLHEKMSTKWFELGQNVGASDAMLSNLRKSPDEDEAHMNKVTQAWIRKGKNQKHPPTWNELRKLLEDVDLNKLADQILEAAENSQSDLHN